MIKAATPPLCRYCGKGLKKWTTTVQIHRGERTHFHTDSSYWRHIYPPNDLKSKDDCKAFTNQIVLSVKYTTDTSDGDPLPDTRRVSEFNEWDGESYQDEFFCGNDHAAKFGFVFAKAGHATKAYAEALKKQREKAA